MAEKSDERLMAASQTGVALDIQQPVRGQVRFVVGEKTLLSAGGCRTEKLRLAGSSSVSKEYYKTRQNKIFILSQKLLRAASGG